MGLNIKNERVCALAKQAAVLTGRTQTSAIELALERLLAEHETTLSTSREARAAGVDAVVGQLQRAWEAAGADDLPSTDDLYDENGLPA